MPNQFAHGKQELRPVAQRNKPKVSKPRVSAQGLSTPQGVVPSEEEKKIMPQTEEFEDMVDAVINPNAGVACNKRSGRTSESAVAPAAEAEAQAPAVLVFGDSLVDNGNNNYLESLAKSDFPPYGVDFPQGPTGRFSNGKTIIDFICEMIGIPYLPPFVDPNTTGKKILAGVNFASAAAGILDDTGLNYGERISLSEQVVNFESMLEELRNETGEEFERYMGKAVVVLVFGSNDYINNYLMPSLYPSSYNYNPQAYGDLLIQHYTRQILALHSLGLRKFAIAGVGPLGCIPNQLAKEDVRNGSSCAARVNDMAILFNNGLASLVNDLNSNHSDAAFTYIDVYRIVGEMLNSPATYGFTVRDRGCCGVDTDQGQIDCIPLTPPCQNRSEYVFWDAFHPTEAANRVLAQRVYAGPSSDCYPINVSQLLMI
ncbi:GDSL esterase/lipase At1g71250-like [Nymphaea colorata]|nr:GDSL esterase/lipase At1g71250-like [Nymphaea colorata]